MATIAYVRVGDPGDADFDAALAELTMVTGASAYIDLAEVTVPSLPLLIFLARVATTIAPSATRLCRASSATRRLIQLAGLDAITTLRDDLPGTWFGAQPP